MKATVIDITEDGRHCKVWDFELSSDYNNNVIYFQYFRQDIKPPKAKKWHNELWWQRIDTRKNTIAYPPLPSDVVIRAREQFKSQIDNVRLVS